MNFETMNKQRKFVLILATVGIISMFLPWVHVSVFGFTQSVNGMHDKGIIVFLCFAASAVIAYLGDQTKNLDKTMWLITLICGALATLIVLWYIIDANGSVMGSFLSFGIYLAGLAAAGLLLSAFIFRSPGDNIKDSFESLKHTISKINTNTSTAQDTANQSTTIPSNTAVDKDTSVKNPGERR